MNIQTITKIRKLSTSFPPALKAHIHGLLVLCLCQPGTPRSWGNRKLSTSQYTSTWHQLLRDGQTSCLGHPGSKLTWKELDAKRVAAPCEPELAGWHERSNPKLWPQELKLEIHENKYEKTFIPKHWQLIDSCQYSHWMSLVTSPTVHTGWATPTGARHRGVFGHFSRVHGWLCTAPDPLEGRVLGPQLLTHRWPWSLPFGGVERSSAGDFSQKLRGSQGVCALHPQPTAGTGLPGPLADSVGGTSPGLCAAWWPAPAWYSFHATFGAPHRQILMNSLDVVTPATQWEAWKLGLKLQMPRVIGLLAGSGNSWS